MRRIPWSLIVGWAICTAVHLTHTWPSRPWEWILTGIFSATMGAWIAIGYLRGYNTASAKHIEWLQAVNRKLFPGGNP